MVAVYLEVSINLELETVSLWLTAYRTPSSSETDKIVIVRRIQKISARLYCLSGEVREDVDQFNKDNPNYADQFLKDEGPMDEP